MSAIVFMQFFQKYINKRAIALKAILSEVSLVRWIATALFRINKIKDSEKRQSESDAHSHHLRIEGANTQNEEIQAMRTFQIKVICSFKD